MKKLKSDQSDKEKQNVFRCMCCDKIRIRGVYVTIYRGEFKGYRVKVCQSAKCIEAMNMGIFLSKD